MYALGGGDGGGGGGVHDILGDMFGRYIPEFRRLALERRCCSSSETSWPGLAMASVCRFVLPRDNKYLRE